MSMINARGTTNGSAYAMWSVMLYGTCKQTDHGCTSCPTSMLSLRSQPLSSALLLKNKPREQHECTNLMHSDLGEREPQHRWPITAVARNKRGRYGAPMETSPTLLRLGR